MTNTEIKDYKNWATTNAVSWHCTQPHNAQHNRMPWSATERQSELMYLLAVALLYR